MIGLVELSFEIGREQPHQQQKCTGSKLFSALKVLLLNQGTFLLHKFVNKKTQQKCASIGINKNVQTPARPR